MKHPGSPGDRVLSHTRKARRNVACKLQTMPMSCNLFATGVGAASIFSVFPQWPIRGFGRGEAATSWRACNADASSTGVSAHAPFPALCVPAACRERFSPLRARPITRGVAIPHGVLSALFCPWRICFISRNESRPSCDDSSRDVTT